MPIQVIYARAYGPWTDAQAERLKQYDSRIQKLITAEQTRDALKRRETYADRLEREYLSKGMDVRITLVGSGKTTIRMQYILAGRPLAYQMANDPEIRSTLQSLGFKRLELSDGYDETYTIDLD
jgi:hypothetical protein